MRRFMLLATSALMALVVLAPAALAQDMMEAKMEEKMEEKKMDDSMMMKEKMEEKKMDDSMMMKEKMEMEEKGKEKMESMPKTGGPEVSMLLLPASALLLCSGVLGYAILRRR
jgi:hypothetical protein